MLRPSITRTCSSPISFNTPPNRAPFVGECSWGFKLSMTVGISQKARVNCWLGQKCFSVASGHGLGLGVGLSSRPSSILSRPFEFCFEKLFSNVHRRLSRMVNGPGLVTNGLELHLSTWARPGLVPGSIFGHHAFLARHSWVLCFLCSKNVSGGSQEWSVPSGLVGIRSGPSGGPRLGAGLGP
ncbi:hypothetical protein LINPERPRIM_LOCUS4792, partial [Linum perenne]